MTSSPGSSTPVRCYAMNGAMRCERQPGHAGAHGVYVGSSLIMWHPQESTGTARPEPVDPWAGHPDTDRAWRGLEYHAPVLEADPVRFLPARRPWWRRLLGLG